MSFDTTARRQAKVVFDDLADRLVTDLAAAAQDDADAAAARARHDAERAAEVAVTNVRAEGEARLAAAQAMNAGLLQSIEEARQQVRALEQRVDQAQQEHLRLTEARDEGATRLELETRRAGVVAAQLDLQTRRAGEVTAQLDGEMRRSTELASQLEAETRRANELTDHLNAETRRSRDLGDAAEEVRSRLDGVVDRVHAAVSAIDRSHSPSEILETLLEPLSYDFPVAAVFLVSPASVNGWRDIGLDSDVTRVVVPRDSDSPLTCAADDRKPLFLTATPVAPLFGLLGNSVARIAVLPVMAGEHVVALAYGENPEPPDPSSGPFPGAGTRIAAMLIDHANLRLTVKRPSAPSPAPSARYSQARQARRVKSRVGVDLTLDGAEGSLVDVSSIGAQVLSPVAMKPNRTLRMMIRAGEQALACKARVVWARFEQPRGTAGAQYRVGVTFTDVEQGAVDDFIVQQGLAQA
jgi:hypothetical protein